MIAVAGCCLLPQQWDWGTANSLWSGLAEWIIAGMVVIGLDPFIQIWMGDFTAGQKMKLSLGHSRLMYWYEGRLVKSRIKFISMMKFLHTRFVTPKPNGMRPVRSLYNVVFNVTVSSFWQMKHHVLLQEKQKTGADFYWNSFSLWIPDLPVYHNAKSCPFTWSFCSMTQAFFFF